MATIRKERKPDGTWEITWRYNDDGTYYNFKTGETTKESPYEILCKEKRQAKSCQKHHQEKGSSTKDNS